MSSVTVMGLDLAAANSGLCIIKAHYPTYTFDLILEEALHHPINDFKNRVDASNYILFLAKEHGVDFAALEDYAMRFGRTNTSGFQYGELGGMVRKTLHEANIPFYVTPPTSMRSFMEVPPKSDKSYLEKRALDRLGFVSSASTKKKRSDITDALIHAHIGALVHIIKHHTLDYPLTTAEHRILFGDSKIVGLINREAIYHGEKN